MGHHELKAVIFDMDGVIVDTFELYYIVNKAIADELSVPFTREDNNEFRGIGRMDIIDRLVERSGQQLSYAERVELADKKNKHYQTLLQKLDEQAILPGMNDLIATLKKNNMKMAIASSSTNSKTVLEKVGLIKYINYIVDPATLHKGKPDPEIFLKAAAGLGVDPVECVAIEDGVAGLQAIRKAKMFSIAVGAAVANEQADWHVDNTSELTYSKLMIKYKGGNNETCRK